MSKFDNAEFEQTVKFFIIYYY